MPRKKKELADVTDQDTEFISGLLEATELAKKENLTLDFTEEEINLPRPVEVKKHNPSGKKPKPRYLLGDRFYTYMGYKRVKGKWHGSGSFMKITDKTKKVEKSVLVDGELTTITEVVRIRKQSNPSKTWLARQEGPWKKDAA